MIPTFLEKDHLHGLAVLAQAHRFMEVVKALELVGHEVGDFDARRRQIGDFDPRIEDRAPDDGVERQALEDPKLKRPSARGPFPDSGETMASCSGCQQESPNLNTSLHSRYKHLTFVLSRCWGSIPQTVPCA
jgi:hypothetical protein